MSYFDEVSINGIVTTNDFMLEIPKGNITGHSQVNKFGANPDSASGVQEDVWDGGGTYSFPTTADITHIEQATDQVADRGGTVEVQGLDTNWALVVQDVLLDASDTTTAMALTTPLKRVFRMKYQEDLIAGDDISIKNVGGGTTYATMQAGNNQTLMAIYTVPAGKTAYMTSYYCDYVRSAVKDPDSIEFGLWAADRNNGRQFQLKHRKGIPVEGTGFQHFFKPYYKFTEKTDIKVTSEADAKAAHTHAGFDLILVDN